MAKLGEPKWISLLEDILLLKKESDGQKQNITTISEWNIKDRQEDN